MNARDLLAATDVGRATFDEILKIADVAVFESTQTLFRAPPSTDVTAGQDAPIPLVAIQVCGPDAGRMSVPTGVITVTHLELNRTWAALWEAPRNSPARFVPSLPPEEEDDEPVTPSTSAMAFRCDLRERIPDLPQRPGTALVRLHLDDQVVGPEFVTFSGGPATSDPEVKAYLEWVATQQPTPPLPAPYTAVDYTPDEWTPAAPAQPGIDLVLQRVSLSGMGQQLALRGSFNLPIAPHQLIAPAAMERTLVDATLVARVSITLVFVSLDGEGPAVLPLHLDASEFTPPGPDGRLHARGVFRAELFAHEQTPRLLGRYMVYAFANEHMAGPYPLTLVGEELVPLVPPR